MLEQEELGPVKDHRVPRASNVTGTKWHPVLVEGTRDTAALEVRSYGPDIVLVRGFSSRMAARNSGNALVRHLNAAKDVSEFNVALARYVRRWRQRRFTVDEVTREA
jgi:hypothetical protein